ncbi:uncharacterized protein LOC114529967 [Dendronephthya gigantea]|uniref:uncharacterized protein LOC114529967 n=1 Tax=Dendronephthya gigantea TaxID=151771 RepID=UPI00106D23DB|nr:uncharacterized protein LOC114529967 [Dendronephthya gigantea]
MQAVWLRVLFFTTMADTLEMQTYKIQDANVPSIDCLPTISAINPNQDEDSESIRDHAGWAVKRARDVISKGQNELPLKETFKKDASIVFGTKSNALTVLSQLGGDQRQPNGNYRFCIHEHVVPFFIFLHKLVESLLSPENILREKGNILKFCLDHMSINEELRARWNELIKTSDIPSSIAVLQRVVTFFIKSKQQIFREQEALKPNKRSVALRQQIRPSVKKCAAVSSTQTRKNQSIVNLRSNFNSSSINAFLLNLKTLPHHEQEKVLGKLQGKELAKILKALKQPAFLGKKKEKQIKSLLEAVKGGLVCANIEEE